MGWWGNWRQTAPAHIGNLQATDLLDCTSIIGGLPVNNTITGAQIIAGASGGSATWGAITGTLSAQTDLQTELNAKQNKTVLQSYSTVVTVTNNTSEVNVISVAIDFNVEHLVVPLTVKSYEPVRGVKIDEPFKLNRHKKLPFPSHISQLFV